MTTPLKETVALAFEVEGLKRQVEYLDRAYRAVAAERLECVEILFDILEDHTLNQWHNKIQDIVLNLGCWGKTP